jgi:8-oxo-dGTP diphosphatase
MALSRQKTIQQLVSENHSYFQMAISVDCVIFGFDNDTLKVLVIKSDLEEFKNEWSLLGDLVHLNEDPDAASYRILTEKTGLANVFLEQVHTFGEVTRHPAGRVVTIAYYSLVDTRNHELNISENELHWHPVNQITSMAFDHLKILQTCLERLQSKVFEHPIVFNLLPEKFSLRQLQTVYEAILGTKLDRRNFRKKFFMLDWLCDTTELEQNVTHRPGRLYRFNMTTQLRQPARKPPKPLII